LPDWGVFSILDVDYSELDNQALQVDKIMENFVSDLSIIFGGETMMEERIVANLKSAINSLSSLSKLLQRVRVRVIKIYDYVVNLNNCFYLIFI
jgi:hypothetical protein